MCQSDAWCERERETRPHFFFSLPSSFGTARLASTGLRSIVCGCWITFSAILGSRKITNPKPRGLCQAGGTMGRLDGRTWRPPSDH